MIEPAVLYIFIPTFFVVSLTPGMCMTLAMTLGMTIGIRKTLWMMLGELLGVATVAVAAVLGVASIMLAYPQLFTLLKLIGALYLCYVGISMWQNKGKLAISTQKQQSNVSSFSLFNQGLITAIANPKGWAFMIALLPPFISKDNALPMQLAVLVSVILISEFVCMMLYATGGKSIAKLISKQNNVQILNKLSGSLMILIAIWLFSS